MSACTFFGHREYYGLPADALSNSIEILIDDGYDIFFVCNQGFFDLMVYCTLKNLQKKYTHIRICLVLAYLSDADELEDALEDAMYPEIEGPPRFSIERRNRWMIDASDFCLCYVNHIWGGAYKFARLAKRRGLQVVNLGKIRIE